MGFFSVIGNAISSAANAVADVAVDGAKVVADVAVDGAKVVAGVAVDGANAVADAASSVANTVTEATKLSKGVDMYGYAADGFAIELYGRSAGQADHDAEKFPLPADGTWHGKSYEVTNASMATRYEGKVGFRLFQAQPGKKEEIYERSLRVNANDGDITLEDMTNILEPSRATDTFCASYGVYNSDGAHVSDLPNRHQLYVSVTRPQRDWQARLLAAHKAQKPTETLHLNQLVLPGSHDAGMFMNLGLPALINMGNTQRDTTYTQLQLGSRYFDFRPGHLNPEVAKAVENIRSAPLGMGLMLTALKNLGGAALGLALAPFLGALRHIHLFVPGETYEQFLRDIVRFLGENPQEIVVVRLSDAGFLDGAVRRPEAAELRQVTAKLVQGAPLVVGDAADLGKPVDELIRTQRRLILFYPDAPLSSVSSYSDDEENDPTTNYHSYDAAHVMEALRQLNQGLVPDSKAGQKTHFQLATTQWVNAQLQLTATAKAGAVTRAVTATSRGTSPLLATKPRTDAQTYTWVRNELGLTGGPLVTICNDYYDNGLTDAVYHANLRRLGLKA